MNSHRWIFIFVVCFAASSLVACGSQEPAAEDDFAQAPAEPLVPQEPAPVTEPAEPIGQLAVGELQAVDLAAETLMLKDMEGNEHTFSFSDTTEIVGAPGAQGLSDQQGNQVIVQHTEQDGRNVAVRIEMIPR